MEYNFSNRLKDLSGNSIREIFKLLSKPEIISFAGGLPASVCLPVGLVEKFSNEILTSSEALPVLQYGATEGYMPLRRNLVSYIEKTSVTGITEDNILIVSGGQQGIDLSIKAFLNEGDVMLVESPTYLAALHIAKTYQAEPKGIQSDDDGINLNDLEEKIKKYKAKVFYIVPNFQNPTGRTLSLKKRKEVAALTAKYGVMVIEDDPYRELRYTGTPLPSIKSFDKDGNVIYITSFSKTISPGLRTGAVIAAENIIKKLTIGKQATDVHTSALSQAIVNKFISNGVLDAIVKNNVPVYLKKRDTMINALNDYMPKSFSFTNPEGGLFIFGGFDKKSGISAKAKFKEAVENNVAYVSGSDFFADGSGENTIRLNFSNAAEEKIVEGVKRLSKVFLR